MGNGLVRVSDIVRGSGIDLAGMVDWGTLLNVVGLGRSGVDDSRTDSLDTGSTNNLTITVIVARVMLLIILNDVVTVLLINGIRVSGAIHASDGDGGDAGVDDGRSGFGGVDLVSCLVVLSRGS